MHVAATLRLPRPLLLALHDITTDRSGLLHLRDRLAGRLGRDQRRGRVRVRDLAGVERSLLVRLRLGAVRGGRDAAGAIAALEARALDGLLPDVVAAVRLDDEHDEERAGVCPHCVHDATIWSSHIREGREERWEEKSEKSALCGDMTCTTRVTHLRPSRGNRTRLRRRSRYRPSARARASTRCTGPRSRPRSRLRRPQWPGRGRPGSLQEMHRCARQQSVDPSDEERRRT